MDTRHAISEPMSSAARSSLPLTPPLYCARARSDGVVTALECRVAAWHVSSRSMECESAAFTRAAVSGCTCRSVEKILHGPVSPCSLAYATKDGNAGFCVVAASMHPSASIRECFCTSRYSGGMSSVFVFKAKSMSLRVMSMVILLAEQKNTGQCPKALPRFAW